MPIGPTSAERPESKARTGWTRIASGRRRHAPGKEVEAAFGVRSWTNRPTVAARRSPASRKLQQTQTIRRAHDALATVSTVPAGRAFRDAPHPDRVNDCLGGPDMDQGEIGGLGQVTGEALARNVATVRGVHQAVARRVFGALGPVRDAGTCGARRDCRRHLQGARRNAPGASTRARFKRGPCHPREATADLGLQVWQRRSRHSQWRSWRHARENG